jgi:adenylate kinase
MKHVNVGELVQEHECYDGRDEALDTNILDEDKLIDIVTPLLNVNVDDNMNGSGDNNQEEVQKDQSTLPVVADFHMCDVFPEHWFDLVLVLRCRTEVLYDRLTKRGYGARKREQNMEAEIMQVILEEAREAYNPAIVYEVPSNTIEDMDSNIERVKLWLDQWIKDQTNST